MYHLNRDICTILENMKKCNETRDYSRLPALIAEAEFVASRREQVEDLSQKEYEELVERFDKKRKEYDKLWEKTRALKEKLGEKFTLAEEMGEPVD